MNNSSTSAHFITRDEALELLASHLTLCEDDPTRGEYPTSEHFKLFGIKYPLNVLYVDANGCLWPAANGFTREHHKRFDDDGVTKFNLRTLAKIAGVSYEEATSMIKRSSRERNERGGITL